VQTPEEKRARDREYRRRYRMENPEKARQARRRYDQSVKGRKRNRAGAQRWRAKNQDRVREEAARYRDENRERRQRQDKERDHGPGIGEVITFMHQQQGGMCYLCGDPLACEDAVIDHDHACCPPRGSCRACRRGLAHNRCNSAIGLAGDDPVRLRRMADNLEAAAKSARSRIAAKPVQGDLSLRIPPS